MRYTYRCKLCGDGYHDVVQRGIRDFERGVKGEFSHLRCRTCRTVQLHPFPELKDLLSAQDLDDHGRDEPGAQGAISRLLDVMSDLWFRRRFGKLIGKDCAVLDLGCGDGEFLSRLRSIGIYQLDGVELDERAVRLARQRGVHVYQGLFADFPSDEQAYDVIFMNHYLAYSLDPLLDIRKAHRLLRPGGVLIGATHNYRAFDRLLFGRYWGGNQAPRQTFLFEETTLRRLLERVGFVMVRFEQDPSTAPMARSLQNLLRGRRLRSRRAPLPRRARAHDALMTALVPANLICMLAGRAGVMRFSATATQAGRAVRGQAPRASGAAEPHPAS